MGLSGRKTKQRIPNDPRNLSWADDASRFGSAYLSKLGFDHTDKDATLGLSGNGLSQHLKVHHKLDLLGIGAQHTQDPNGLAWNQNRDFEDLLRRLNAADSEGDAAAATTGGVVVDGFQRAGCESGVEDEKKGRKRKRDKEEAGDDESDSEMKKKKKKKKKDKKAKVDEGSVQDLPQPSSSSAPTPPLQGHRGRAHRARFIAAKRLAASSSTAVSEILGVAASSTSASGITTPQDEKEDEGDLNNLNVSSTSIGDYFKAKMKLISGGQPVVKATDELDSEVLGLVRRGIGSKSSVIEEARDEAGEERMGLGLKLGLGMMAGMGIAGAEDAGTEVVKKRKRKDKAMKKERSKQDDEQSGRDEQGKKKQKKARGEKKKRTSAIEL